MAFDGRLAEHDEILPAITADADPLPPSAIERRLLAIAETRDRRAYLKMLAAQPLYHPIELGAATDTSVREAGTFALDGRTVCPVYTAGVLPRPHPRYVFEATTLGALADMLPDPAERRVDAVAVNPRTPWSTTLPTDAAERAVWRTLTKDPSRTWPPDGLVTHAVRAARRGPLLHGLACGAQLCMLNGVPWNTLDFHGAGFSNERHRLRVWWGVTDRETWKATRNRLLGIDVPPDPWELVLDARVRLAARFGLPVPPGVWRDSVEARLRRMWNDGAPCPPGADALLDTTVAELRALVGSITWYEARFRADGLLAPGAVIPSAVAWNLGRASMMARWGVACRYGTENEVRRALEHVSGQARRVYGSWEEFGAGYVLGRCLHFDAEEFGSWYTDARWCFQTLTSDTDSPWRTVPFRL